MIPHHQAGQRALLQASPYKKTNGQPDRLYCDDVGMQHTDQAKNGRSRVVVYIVANSDDLRFHHS